MFPLLGLWELCISATRDAGSCGAGEGVSQPFALLSLENSPGGKF